MKKGIPELKSSQEVLLSRNSLVQVKDYPEIEKHVCTQLVDTMPIIPTIPIFSTSSNVRQGEAKYGDIDWYGMSTNEGNNAPELKKWKDTVEGNIIVNIEGEKEDKSLNG